MKKYNNEWFFGNGMGLNFNTLVNGKPTPTSPNPNGNALYTIEGSSSICNPDTGELLFYTDGITIWDSNHAPLLDGGGIAYKLEGNASSVNAAIIVPIPGTKDEFYIITPGETSGLVIEYNQTIISSGMPIPPNSIVWFPAPSNSYPAPLSGIRKHKVKVDLVTKIVSVISINDDLNVPLTNINLSSFFTEKLCVLPHQNCKDFWLITEIGTKQVETDPIFKEDAQVLVFLITQSAITFMSKFDLKHAFSSLSTIKANHDGTKIAIGTYNNKDKFYTKKSRIDIYPFDNATGIVSVSGIQNDLFNDPYETIYGLEFSKNGKFLYYTTGSNLFQLNVSDYYHDKDNNNLQNLNHYVKQLSNLTSVANTKLSVPTFTFGLPQYRLPHLKTKVGALSMGPDGIIYVARPGFKMVGGIENSDDLTASFVNNYIDFSNSTYNLNLEEEHVCYKGLPTMLTLVECNKPNPNKCKEIQEQVNSDLKEQCQSFVNELDHCDKDHICDCNHTDVDKECKTIEKPEVSPCITIKWGEKEKNCLAGCDSHVMCITVCNCYSNIVLKNFSIGLIEVLDEKGEPVTLLPNGKSPLSIVPRGPFCFGDIESCSCVSREFSLIIKCAEPGNYKVKIAGICFDVCFHYDSENCFNFEICSD